MRPYNKALLGHLNLCASFIAADIDTIIDLGRICQTVFLKHNIKPRHHNEFGKGYDLYVDKRESPFFDEKGEIDCEISKYPHLKPALLKYPQCKLDRAADRYISVLAACSVIEFARRIDEFAQEAIRNGIDELPELLWTWGGGKSNEIGYMTNKPLLPESYYMYGVWKLSEAFKALSPARKDYCNQDMKAVIKDFEVYSSNRTTRRRFRVVLDWNANPTAMNRVITCSPKSPYASRHRDLILSGNGLLDFTELHTRKCISYVIDHIQDDNSPFKSVAKEDLEHSATSDTKRVKDIGDEKDEHISEEQKQAEVGETGAAHNTHRDMDVDDRAVSGATEGQVLQSKDANVGPPQAGNVQKRNLEHVPAEFSDSAKKIKRNSKPEKGKGNVTLTSMNYFYKR
ncbi:hypothetical protein I302_103025 [Kwoniella bestiolae CBS 10118]|uniref:Uncharacterized protein n=1 Tax=Kwoniella bestiolae CBS 10118 TaxID=1296100 RepID=A0AAJ8K4K8_9TREE